MNFTLQNLGDTHPQTEKSRTNKNKQINNKIKQHNKNKIERNQQCVHLKEKASQQHQQHVHNKG